MTAVDTPVLLSTLEVCHRVGIRHRMQLDRWVKQGWVTPTETRSNPGSNRRHLWSPTDIRVIRVVQLLRRAAALPHERPNVDWPRLAALVVANPVGWLIVGDGGRLAVADTAEQALTLIEAASCAICITPSLGGTRDRHRPRLRPAPASGHDRHVRQV